MTMTTAIAATLTVACCATLAIASTTSAADHRPPKTDPEKITNAMTAAPAAISRDASVIEMKEDGSMAVLRKGHGQWTCVPDDPSTPGNDPMCLDPNAMEWAHAWQTHAPPPDKIASSTCSTVIGERVTPTLGQPNPSPVIIGSRREPT